MKEFRAESKKLLDLVVNSIYANREIFLRELISNASDALDKRRFMSLTDSSLDAEFAIEITADKAKRTLTVSDNGVGMSEKELEDNLGVIAASGTETFKKSLGENDDKTLIGQFGVGFYASFMVADKVTVISRKVGETNAHKWESNGVDGFEITDAERDAFGTSVILHLKDDGDENYSQYLEAYEIRTLVKKYSDYIRYPIRTEKPKAESESGVTVGELDTLNSMTPVWKKSKTDLAEGELDEFFKHTFREYDAPLLTVTTRVEGAVEYTALLFVPSAPPFDFYTKDYKRGLQLYCNGVLIMDKCSELIPEYLGFVRGVVETSDLSLNISRETFQEDRRVRAIANGLEKKLLAEFDKLLKNDREKYEKLFTAFAKAIKFGAYDDYGANKDKLKDLLLYYSDKNKKLVTLKEFCAELDKDAPVPYACGETVEKIAMQPQLEGARASGNDVLYFTDPVDEFMARMLDSYDGHKFRNIASGEAEAAASTSGHEELTARIQKSLGDKAAVAPTDKLKSYPVCLAAKGDVSLEMERVLAAMGGGLKAERVLQVNFEHPAIARLGTLDGAEFDDTVTVLYNEALLAEGYKTEPEFLAALNRVLSGRAVKPAAKKAPAKTAKPSATKTGAGAKKSSAGQSKTSSTASKSKSGTKPATDRSVKSEKTGADE